MLTTPPSWETWQRIINGQDVPDRRDVTTATEPIPVVTRIVWGVNGEEHVDERAIRWTFDLVLVELRDPRSSTVGPWLAASDVRRRPP